MYSIITLYCINIKFICVCASIYDKETKKKKGTERICGKFYEIVYL